MSVSSSQPSGGKSKEERKRFERMANAQTDKDKRNLRFGYRQLIQETTENREDLAHPDNHNLTDIVERGNELLNDVTAPLEATLDAEFMSMTTKLGAAQVAQMRTGIKQYELSDFIVKLRSYLRMPNAKANDEKNANLDWIRMGREVQSLYFRTSGADFLFGAMPNLDVDMRKKDKERKKRVVQEYVEAVVPDVVVETADEKVNETSARVTLLYRHIKKEFKRRNKAPINFFEVILNPDSFSQSVENMFHLSFLIRDGKLRTFVDRSQNPMVAPPEEMAGEGNAQTNQAVVSLNYIMWKEMCQKLGLKKPLVPTRETSDAQKDYLPSQVQKQEAPVLIENEARPKKATRKRKEKEPSQQVEKENNDNDSSASPQNLKRMRKGNRAQQGTLSQTVE